METPPSRTASPPPARSRLRRALLLATGVIALAILIAVGRPAAFLAYVWLRDPCAALPDPGAGRGDFGRFDKNAPHEIVSIPADPKEAERQLVALVLRAARGKLKISISGAKHSMGGHTLYPGGIALDMLGFDAMSLDEEKRILTVGAGARWSQVIPFLDQRGFAVDVMQSSNDFTVGGSLSVNCHGWQPHSPPIDSTVESFRIITAEGKILRCSRTENTELFSLALGGYGLFGIILDADLRVAPNVFYTSTRYKVKPADYAALYEKVARGDPSVGLSYGRISIAPASFLDDAFIVVLKKDPDGGIAKNTLAIAEPHRLERIIFRGSVGSEYGKNLCWRIESFIGGEAAGTHSRNQIMNEPSEWISNRDPAAV
ncbi:MAG TPA: FAD-binding oxidoreductase, partial [Chthoniobacteraceae bacterium]|nr:FAD-binding oxidoreductase [Chthoniobacteraceae bacterium]